MTTKFVLSQNLTKNQTAENPILGEYLFDGNIFTVGSDAANNLVLPEAAAEQFVVMREDGRLTLINSHEGTVLNTNFLRREAIEPISGGDIVKIGNYTISVVVGEEGAATVEAPASKAFRATADAANNPASEKQAPARPPEAPKPLAANAAEPTSQRNFADVLDTLRTEEDSFYFIRHNENGETANVPLEDVATPIGETAGGDIAFTIAEISAIYAIARKDWSGILLESQRRGAVFVNDEPVDATRRLRNDDRVTFTPRTKVALVLHEPSSLVALESLLSARVEPGSARFGGLAAQNAAVQQPENQTPTPPAKAKASPLERRYFNHFSLFEVAAMIIGTLIGAVLIFLLLEVVLA